MKSNHTGTERVNTPFDVLLGVYLDDAEAQHRTTSGPNLDDCLETSDAPSIFIYSISAAECIAPTTVLSPFLSFLSSYSCISSFLPSRQDFVRINFLETLR
jgi:hypothetical protein